MKILFNSIIIIILTLALFTSCDTKNGEKSTTKKIIVSNWIGYVPLLYAYENGKLDNLNIDIVVTNSLQSSLNLIKRNNYDAIAVTQKEFFILNDKISNNSYEPLVLIDRSYGGDAVLSNISKETLLKKQYSKLNIFLEKDSVNEIVLDCFVKSYNIDEDKIVIHNMNQENILDLKCVSKDKSPKLIVTYEPYLSKLVKSGFNIISSTKDDDIFVLDFLAVKKDSFTKDELIELSSILNEANLKLQEEPLEVYKSVKIYITDICKDEFLSSLNQIEIVTDKNIKKIEKLIDKNNLDIDFKNIK